ncbi:MAG: T9SS type A sorting domain-containing protein [Flavobacteriales bacterium]|nr:T9SS type A sorting domain-containing protein [Flavobacteriales bacterium]
MKKHLLTLCAWALSAYISLGQIYGDPVYYWDFSGGIPSSWENSSISGIGTWEYRGPFTEPNNTVCSQGSCGIGSAPIASMSWDNGFVIFDSNYWDDSDGPCGNLGSGADPGPHEAWLITESIDLSGLSAPTLAFQQQYKHYITSAYDIYTSVWISVDDGEFQLVHENPGDYAVSPTAEWVNINLNGFGTQSDNVRFKFLFSGMYYWWCLDDIAIYQPYAEDILIDKARYTKFNGDLDPYGFGDMEYHSYSQSMLPEFNFSAWGTNIGYTSAGAVHLELSIENSDNTVIHEQTSYSFSLAAAATFYYETDDSYVPDLAPGVYDIEFLINQNENDQSPLNNYVYKDFIIHPFQMGLDEGQMNDQFQAGDLFQDEDMYVGDLYQTWESGLEIQSVSVYFGDQSDVSTPVYVEIYDFNKEILFGHSASYNLNIMDLNSLGSSDGQWVTFPLEEYVTTQDTSLFFVMVGDSTNQGNMSVGRSGAIPDFASQVGYPESNGLYYMTTAGMIRINLFEPGVISGCTDSEAANYNAQATYDDFSCRYAGCTDPEASNYDSTANWDDDSCISGGCTDPAADNYDPDADVDDGSCLYYGCMDTAATNYDSTANADDGSCIYVEAFVSANQTTGCAPLTITFTNQTEVAEGGLCTFVIDGELEINECQASFTHTFNTPGTYSLTFTYQIGEFISEYTIDPIEVFAPPADPVITYNTALNEISCDCPADIAYSWYYNDDLLSSTESVLHPEENGEYYLTITDDHGCTATSATIPVVIIGVEESEIPLFSVHPNPAQDFFVVTGSGAYQVEVLDLQGRVVVDKLQAQGQMLISTSTWTAGTYLVRFLGVGTSQTRRVVVQR